MVIKTVKNGGYGKALSFSVHDIPDFIIGTIVIRNQIRFMLNADFGFKTDAVITIDLGNDKNENSKIFAEKVNNYPALRKLFRSIVHLWAISGGTDQ